MATKTKHDLLEQAKIGNDGEPAIVKTAREQAKDLLAKATEMFPQGLPANSVFAQMSRDSLLGEGNRVGMTLGPLMSVEEQRLALEYYRAAQAMAPTASTPVGAEKREEPPPVPMQRVERKKIQGVPHSPSGVWRVKNQLPKNVSIGGQICVMHSGHIIRDKHYLARDIAAMAAQGLELEAIDEADID